MRQAAAAHTVQICVSIALLCAGSETHAARRGLFGKSRNGSIVVRGKVLGKDGSPIDNVQVYAKRVKGVAFAKGTQTTETVTVSGDFEFIGRGISDLHLNFDKDGYYSVRRSYSADTDIADETIVLEEQGRSMPMFTSGITRLVLSGDGTGSAIDMSNTPSRVSAGSLADEEDIPDHALRLSAQTGAGGLVLETSPVEGSAKGRPWPKGLELQTTSPEDGLVLFLSGEQRPMALVFREMREAPEGGYERSMRIPARQGLCFFFLRTAGRYGKGFINVLPPARDGSQVRCTIRVFIQKGSDGSRNVNMKHY